MDFTTMQTFICNKVTKTDTYSQARCLEYIKARHKMIYEAFDWKAAQILVAKVIAAGGGTTTSLNIPEVHHIIAARLDGKELDPATPSFVFDRETTDTDEMLTAGTPKFYEEFLDMSSQTRSIRFFSPLADDGAAHNLLILGKAPYNESATQTMIPATENALIAFATGDMWEYLHEVGKGQAKLAEGAQLLDAAKQQDTPGSQRPRSMRKITARGNSLIELTDAVCDIVKDFTPTMRNSVRALIRRCYQNVWNAAAWPETIIVDSATPANGVAIFTHLIDKIIAVRANLSTTLTQASYQTLEHEDSAVIMGITPEAFSQDGTPINYNILLPVALPVPLTGVSFLKFLFASNEKQTITIRGELGEVDVHESLVVGNSATSATKLYDIVYAITKPASASNLLIQDTGGNTLMTFQPTEQGRKYPRIQVLPDFDTTQYPDQALYVIGKRRLPQLLDDGDEAVLTGVENILINTAAAEIFSSMGRLDVAQVYRGEATLAMKTLIDRETSQQTYHPRVLPYTEPDAGLIVGL